MLNNLQEKFIEIRDSAAGVAFSDIGLSQEFKDGFQEYIAGHAAGGYSQVEWARYSAKILTNTGRSFTLPNYWFLLAYKLSDYLQALHDHRDVFLAIYAGEDLHAAASTLRVEVSERELGRIRDYFERDGKTEDELRNFIQFLSAYDTWGGGKTIDRGDYYVSALMKAGGLLAETQGGIAEIATILHSDPQLKMKLGESLVAGPLAALAERRVINGNLSHLSKPFVLLAGISGTGKTRFVREQAQEDKSNYEIVAVRPDWHEPSDLLGYVSRIGGNGAHYVVTDVLKFMVNAWKAALNPAQAGELKPLNEIEPFWLCLDEMNLAPVEQYFSDYLSVLETRKWEDDKYSCDPILKLGALKEQLGDNGIEKLRTELGIEKGAAENDALWDFFESQKGISLPPNLIVAGTVNMDETTHGFSRKVIDRAFTIDFGKFFPNDYDSFFNQETRVKKLGFPVISHIKEANMATVPADSDGKKSITFLKELNSLLSQTPFELAYRSLNELLLAVVCFRPEDDVQLQAVWDDFLMTKVLPRIEGDAEKLRSGTGAVAGYSLLQQLGALLEAKLPSIWNASRPDLLRENIDGTPLAVGVRSKEKLLWMQERLDKNGFTAFWP